MKTSHYFIAAMLILTSAKSFAQEQDWAKMRADALNPEAQKQLFDTYPECAAVDKPRFNAEKEIDLLIADAKQATLLDDRFIKTDSCKQNSDCSAQFRKQMEELLNRPDPISMRYVLTLAVATSFTIRQKSREIASGLSKDRATVRATLNILDYLDLIGSRVDAYKPRLCIEEKTKATFLSELKRTAQRTSASLDKFQDIMEPAERTQLTNLKTQLSRLGPIEARAVSSQAPSGTR